MAENLNPTIEEVGRVMRQRPEPPDPPLRKPLPPKPPIIPHRPRKLQVSTLLQDTIKDIRDRKEKLYPAVREYYALQTVDAKIMEVINRGP